MRRVLCLIVLSLTGLRCGSGPGIDTSPLADLQTTTSGDAINVGSTDGADSNASISTAAVASIAQIEGLYGFDSVDCTVEQVATGSPNLTQLNVIKSKQGQWQFLITLDSTSTLGNVLLVTDRVRGTTQHVTVTSTSSGTFATFVAVGRQCGWEFVAGGAIATCYYAEVPATCSWYLARS